MNPKINEWSFSLHYWNLFKSLSYWPLGKLDTQNVSKPRYLYLLKILIELIIMILKSVYINSIFELCIGTCSLLKKHTIYIKIIRKICNKTHICLFNSASNISWWIKPFTKERNGITCPFWKVTQWILIYSIKSWGR